MLCKLPRTYKRCLKGPYQNKLNINEDTAKHSRKLRMVPNDDPYNFKVSQ